MSIDKKETELECLTSTILLGKKQRGITKQIIDLLDGDDIGRDFEERPDFIRVHHARDKSQIDTLIGIEHFRVDHLSKKKHNGNVASTGAMYSKEVQRVFDKWQDKMNSFISEEDIPEEIISGAVSDIADACANQITRYENSSYWSFIDSFHYSLNKHLERSDEYRKNIQLCGSGDTKCVKLALLIEIHTEFSHLFLNDNKGTRRNTTGAMPIFSDIARLLENIDKRQVDYIVLSLYSYKTMDGPTKIIALRTGNIYKQLRKTNTKIYDYAGEEYLLKNVQNMHTDVKAKPTWNLESGKVHFTLDLDFNDIAGSDRLGLISYGVLLAQQAAKRGENYATTLGVQMFLDVYGEYFLGWKKSADGKLLLNKPIFGPIRQEELLEKQVTFQNQWQFSEEEN